MKLLDRASVRRIARLCQMRSGPTSLRRAESPWSAEALAVGFDGDPRYREEWQRALVRSQSDRSARVVEAQLQSMRQRTDEDWQRIVYDMLTFPPGWEPPESEWSGLIEQQAQFMRARR